MYNVWFICAFDHRYLKCKKGTCGDVSYCIIVKVLRHCGVCCNTELVKAPYGSHWPYQGGNQNLMAIMSILIQYLITQQNHVMFYVFAVYTCIWYCSVCFLHFMWATCHSALKLYSAHMVYSESYFLFGHLFNMHYELSLILTTTLKFCGVINSEQYFCSCYLLHLSHF